MNRKFPGKYPTLKDLVESKPYIKAMSVRFKKESERNIKERKSRQEEYRKIREFYQDDSPMAVFG